MSVFSYLQTGTTRQLQMVSTVFHELTSLTFSGLPLRLCLFRTSAVFFMLSSILNSTTAHPLDFPSASIKSSTYVTSPTFSLTRSLCDCHFTSKGMFVMKASYLLVGLAYGSKRLPLFWCFSPSSSHWSRLFSFTFRAWSAVATWHAGAPLSSSILGSVAVTLAGV